MNTKRLIPAMLLAMALVMFWSFGVKYVYHRMGWALPGEQTEQKMPATEPATTAATPTSQPTTIVAIPSTQPAQPPLAGIMPVPATPSNDVVLGSEQDKDQ